jgi:ATP-dependent exoDNAse (exonuclease V) beta subunit
VEAVGTVKDAPAGRPPLRRPERSRRPDVPLSFSTLTVLEDCPARFYATQVLKIDEPDDGSWHSEAEVVLDPEDQSPLTVKEATAFGLAVHEVLEATAGRRWIRPTEGEIASRLVARGLDAGDQTVLGRATGMIFGFLDSPLGLRVAGERCDVELPLLFDAGGITIRGFADLLVPASDPPLILDYKSNRLDGTTAEAKMEEQYTLQRDLYGLAVARGLGKETVDTAFVFLEAVTEPVELRLGPEELERAQARLDGLTGMLRSGSFFGEDGAARVPCGSCWACEQLADRIADVDRAAV